MSDDKLNLAFNIPVAEIEEKIKYSINGDSQRYDHVVSLRDIVSVKNISFFKENAFYALIRNIPLRTAGETIYPYAEASIEVFGREPKGTRIGQRFVHEGKLLSIMSSLGRGVFSDFLTKGISKMPPAVVYGLDAHNRPVVAFYVPPIIEIQNSEAVLVDGIHRSYVCDSAGTTINAVHISGPISPLPFDPIFWRNAQLVKDKPPIEERYVNLRRELFRDLGAVGIDG